MKATPNLKTHLLDIETFVIKPSESHKVLLGTFPNGSEPQFHTIYHDHNLESPTVVSYHDVSVSQLAGAYRLFRQFQSYSQVAHRITVRFRTAADKDLCCS